MYKLVLVDDEAEIRHGLAQYFPWQQLGYQITGVFDSGPEALTFMASHPVDVLLCDISMPGMSGLEVARMLHEQGSRVRVLLLSGHKDFDFAKQALTYNVRSYIVKPTDYEELYLEFSKLKQELDEATAEAAAASFEPAYGEKVVASVLGYVRREYAEATLEQAARLVNLSPDYLSKYIKQQTGRTFSSFVVEARMLRAAELLEDIHYKAFEISEMVGYKHPKNFTRTFKQYYGASPREYRNRSPHLPAQSPKGPASSGDQQV